MAYLSALVQRVLNQIFYDNSTVITQSDTETNLSLIASLEYVQNYTQYYLDNTYMAINNPHFTGLMNGPNIILNDELFTPSESGSCNFTGSPMIQNNNIEFDILGEIKMVVNDLPPNYILCDGASYTTSTYPLLFNLIGYKYGGSGIYFNVPNFNSFFPIGANSANSNNCAVSNFSSGNGQSGAINNYSVSTKFGGDSITALPPLLTSVPNHAHFCPQFIHTHGIPFAVDTNVYILSDVIATLPLTAQVPTPQPIATATTGVTVEDSGDNIQATDPKSGLNGVNVCPPYTCVKFAICYATA
jgi:hypothetical protein